jgi:hypothetical protein
MHVVSVRVLAVACAVAWSIGLTADGAYAQAPSPPGQPEVQVNGNDIVITFAPSVGATGYFVAASFNGVTIPGSPFFVATATSIPHANAADGSYTIQIIAANAAGQTASVPTTFVVGSGGAGPVGTPAMNPPTVAGSAVTLTWTPAANAAGYEVEATVQATGQVFALPVGNQTSLTVPGVPGGNFIVRVRARNAFGVGTFSNAVVVVVGIVLGQGDMQATLTWNSAADVDLHVIEPSGTHVYYVSRNGLTARLDVDDIDGFGPENIFVTTGTAVPGIYQVYIVHYTGNTPTTATVAITLNAGTPNAQTALFTRVTSLGAPSVGFNVANVDIGARQIVETSGTRAADARGETPRKTPSREPR